MIKKLDQSSILNLCVNQVIIDLATWSNIYLGVKELVENSLDAGSTKIEVYLKEFGKEGIEVADNGSGISINNLETIALKGATSKLRQFQDLECLDTFGFRGEALNAISVLSQLTITTRTENEEMANRFQFNQDNTVKSKSLVPRERGTTIGLSDLFGNIPVRKQEFNKNIISQYNKLVNLITEYALISINCQICLVNQTSKKGREMIINSGPPMKNMLQKTAQVFSKKISDMLVELKFDFEEESKIVEGYVLNKQTSGSVTESKLIQKNMTYFYANTRPINPLKKMNSIFNDVYKKYNQSARYVYILHMQIKKDAIDFNVSPDKRDIYIKYETQFYAKLRENLTLLFERLNSVQKVLLPSQISNKKNDIYMNEEEGEDENEDNQNKRSSKQLQIQKQASNRQSQLNFQKLAQEMNEESTQNSFSASSKSSLKSNFTGKKENIANLQNDSSTKKSQQFDSDSEDSDKQSKIFNQKKDKLNKKTELQEQKQYFQQRNQTQSSHYFNIAEERKKAYQQQLNEEQSNENDEENDFIEHKQQNLNQKQSSAYQVKEYVLPSQIGQKNEQINKEQDNEDKLQNTFSYFNDKLTIYKTSKQESEQQQNENKQKYKVREYTSSTLIKNQLQNSEQNNSDQEDQDQLKNSNQEENILYHNKININIKVSNKFNKGNDYKLKDQDNQQNQNRMLNEEEDECCTQQSCQKQQVDGDEQIQSKQTKKILNTNNNQGFKLYEFKQESLKQNLDEDDIEEISNEVNERLKNQTFQDFDVEQNKQENTFQMKNQQKTNDDIKELAEDLEEQVKNWEKEDFKKEKFVDLQIIGQFNKAFIIAYWVEKNEIFLIDQHASDEKTNYERLLKENVFQGQRLVKAIELNLTAQEAEVLENNRDVFKKNGFQFKIQYDETSGDSMLQINQLPSSKHIQFDINDFDEIFQNVNCEETDHQTFRPKKIQKILASKACRSSIMIGDALNKQQMKQVLINLSNLQSPWNCPHGRPTMVKTPPMNHLVQQVQMKKVYDL